MAAAQGPQLLPGEHVVSGYNLLTLTNYRVFRETTGAGQSKYTSITLDAVSSCGLVTSSQPVLLILGILAAVAGLAIKDDAQVVLLLAGVLLVIMYFATLTAVLVICSNGGERITVPAKAQQRASLMVFINALDEEKLTALGRIGTAQRAPMVAPPLPAPVRVSGPAAW